MSDGDVKIALKAKGRCTAETSKNIQDENPAVLKFYTSELNSALS